MKKIYLLTISVFIGNLVFSQANAEYLKNNKQGMVPKFVKVGNNTNLVKGDRDVIWSDDFQDEDLSDWTIYDEDGDSYTWHTYDNFGNIVATSASYNGNVLTPNNWLVSPAITLPSGAVFLDYNATAQDQTWPSEHYKLMISTTDNLVASFTTILFEETIVAGDNLNTISLAEYAGKTVYLAWVHYDCTDLFRLNLDDISVYSSAEVDLSITEIISPTNESSCTLSAAEDVIMNIANVGGVDATGFDVSYTIDGGIPVVETYTNTIASGTSVTYTFTEKADLSGLAYYNIVFEIIIDNDVNLADNTVEVGARNTDGTLVVRAFSDSEGSQEWWLFNNNNEIVGHHDAYQWDILEETRVCILDDDCYKYSFTGFDETGWVQLVYNGAVIAGGEDPGNTVGGVDWYSIGDACAEVDASLSKITTPDYSLPSSIDITGTILNMGLENITSFDVIYTIDGGAESSIYSVTGVNIATGDTYDFTHDVAYSFDNEAMYLINVVIVNVNDDADANVDNNTLSKNILISATQLQRVSVLEQFTTENSGNCPPVFNTIKAHMEENPNFILMSHHSGHGTDSYTIPENTDHLEFYNNPGNIFTPTGMVDRHYNGLNNDGYDGVDPGPVFWDIGTFGTSRIDERTEVAAFVTVNITGANMDGELSLNVSGDFIAGYTHDIGVSLWITEDKIATSTQEGVDGIWRHRYTVRDAISARLGDPIESTTAAGDSYSKNYTFTIDDSWNVNELYLVAMVNNMNASDVNDREIHNAKQVKLSELQPTVVSEINKNFNIYPNPANNVINIINAEKASVEIFNSVGKLVISRNNINANESINVSTLKGGMYFVKINKSDIVETRKILITKH